MTTEANAVLFKKGEAAVWIQPSGPGTKFVYLNCAGMDGYNLTEGDITLRYCKDPARPGRYKVIDSYQGEKSPVTSTLSLPFGKATNYALSLKCPFNLQVRFTTCERQDDPTGWERILHFQKSTITARSSQALVSRAPNEEGEVLTQANISAEELVEVREILVVSQANTELAPLNDVTAENDDQCANNCGPAVAGCQTAWAVGDAETYLIKSQVIKKVAGSDWAQTAADPFAIGEDISSVVINGDRVIVARGEADGANPAEIGYTDDLGVTWNLVNVGSLNGQYITRMVWLSRPYLWAVTNDGYVYFSEDAGLSWTAQSEGVATSQQLNDVDFSDSDHGWAVGNSNAAIYTGDGGLSWNAITGPDVGVVLNTVDVVDSSNIWVGSASGKLWHSTDGGTTWTQVRFSGDGAGQVRDVEFYNENFGFMLHNTAGPVGRPFRTIDGGYSWQLQSGYPTNVGMNRLNVCNPNEFFAVGELQGSNPMIMKGS